MITTNKPYDYLAAIEMSSEGNYNMVDGIINNIQKASLLDQMKEYERKVEQDDNKPDSDSDEKELCRSCGKYER
jgi:hypothetical protein